MRKPKLRNPDGSLMDEEQRTEHRRNKNRLKTQRSYARNQGCDVVPAIEQKRYIIIESDGKEVEIEKNVNNRRFYYKGTSNQVSEVHSKHITNSNINKRNFLRSMNERWRKCAEKQGIPQSEIDRVLSTITQGLYPVFVIDLTITDNRKRLQTMHQEVEDSFEPFECDDMDQMREWIERNPDHPETEKLKREHEVGMNYVDEISKHHAPVSYTDHSIANILNKRQKTTNGSQFDYESDDSFIDVAG